MPPGRRGCWYDRLYAALLERICRCYNPLVWERKKSLLAPLAGTVIEIGSGTGANFEFLGAGVRWVGLDLKPAVQPYVARAAARCGIPGSFVEGEAERLPFRDASADAVIATLVLCSVRDPARVLAEILRVLKPGGCFVFLEHVAAEPGAAARRRQRLVRPVWSLLADGCRPDRETWRSIESAGFAEVRYERFALPLPIVGPHIAGLAVKDRLG